MGRREPSLRLLGADQPVRRGLAGLVAILAVGLGLLAGCGGSSSAPSPSPSAPTSPASPGSPTVSPTRAAPAPAPKNGACYNLTFDQALAPTTPSRPVPCDRVHTTETYAVGRLQTVVDGHQLGVQSARIRDQVAASCPKQLPAFLHGSLADVRLSMVRPVWFTPTLEEWDTGAAWYRCDAVVIAGPQSLVRRTTSLKGALGKDETAAGLAMCGTAEPGTSGFTRVPCRSKHSWRAIQTVPLTAGPYPGEATVRAAGQATCKNAGRDVAQNALDYQWGYEWPTKDQWAAGQTYGICWAPATG